MRKKLSYFIVCIITIFIFKSNAVANTSCYYFGSNKIGSLSASFEIKGNGKLNGKAYLDGRVVSTDESYINGEKQSVENWDSFERGSNFQGKAWYIKYKTCPPYAVFVDRTGQFDLFVSDEENLEIFENWGKKKQGYQILRLVNKDLVGMTYTINFYANKEGVSGEMNSFTAEYGIDKHLPENKFSISGYMPVGWMVMNDGKWLCELESSGSDYIADCPENKRILLKDQASIILDFSPTNPVLDLYVKWKVSSTINTLDINSYNLGEDICKSKGYVWNETIYGNYCNIDNLTYVGCGDASDIPSQVPGLISFGVNLLKIATPIILIIVSIITLIKALSSSKEDEIKKAQSSLLKRMISAALVFFVVSIVQYVILWVADSTDTDSISACMSCFLNNDCDKNIYYKTKNGTEYQCTYISTGESFECN